MAAVVLSFFDLLSFPFGTGIGVFTLATIWRTQGTKSEGGSRGVLGLVATARLIIYSIMILVALLSTFWMVPTGLALMGSEEVLVGALVFGAPFAIVFWTVVGAVNSLGLAANGQWSRWFVGAMSLAELLVFPLGTVLGGSTLAALTATPAHQPG